MNRQATTRTQQATKVASIASSILQRKCACGQHTVAGGECEFCRRKRLTPQRVAVNSSPASEAPLVVHEALRSPGQPLDAATRAFMEPRFGHDFSRVRVHMDARAAESARAVGALAYTVGANVTFAEGQYQPTTEAGQRLLAHELTHVVQQRHALDVVRGAPLTVGAPGDRAEREADQAADALDSRDGASLAPLYYRPASTSTLQRQPAAKTTVRVQSTGSTSSKDLPQGKGGSGAIVYQYDAIARHAPADQKDETKGGSQFGITLPLLVYPPATLNPPKVDLFVFFHGYRADLEERAATGGGAKAQGNEPIALWSHLKEAVAGTDRIGIAPQAPKTWGWRTDKQEWQETWNWREALTKTGFDGLIKIVLEGLTRDLGLGATPLEANTIHVAGHSAGGVGIGEATALKGGAKLFGDKVQDVTLQDAGYDFGGAWNHLMDWFLHGSPGKTVRVLIAQGGPRSVLGRFNVEKINEEIKTQKQSDTFKAEKVTVPAQKDQKPRPGGFVLESQLVVKNLKTGDTQGTMVVFFAPGGGHYEAVTSSMGAAAAAGPKITETFLGEAKPGQQYRVINKDGTVVFKDEDLSKPKGLVLPRDTMVEVAELKQGKKKTSYNARIKDDKGKELGWTPLANLAPPTQPIQPPTQPPTQPIQPKRIRPAGGPDEERDARTQKAAAGGLSGSGTALPYLERIQRAFGPRHDLSSVRAHLDERTAAASRSIGAAAYTVGDAVAFGRWPDLHTATHEAAHVVQQRRGVSLPSGVGREHDPHEQHADAVADAVVAGHSAVPLLDGPSAGSGTSHTALQYKDKPLPKDAIPSSDLDPMDTPEETAFMAKVYDAQQQWAITNRIFTPGLPDSELDEIEDKIKMHKLAVPDAKALLHQARADLAAQQAATDQHALKVKKIGIDNAYRGMANEKDAWESSFRKHYRETKKERAALDGGEFGDAAVQLLAKQMRGFKAIPGFSNHSKGLAIDFMTIEKGLGSLGPDSGQKESWRKSWFWAWLNDHAATYNFSPLSTEEWHWDHS